MGVPLIFRGCLKCPKYPKKSEALLQRKELPTLSPIKPIPGFKANYLRRLKMVFVIIPIFTSPFPSVKKRRKLFLGLQATSQSSPCVATFFFFDITNVCLLFFF